MSVQDEDIQLIEWVNEGMRSTAYDGLMLSDREVGVAAFHNQLRAELPVLNLAQAPEPGTLTQVNTRMLTQGSDSVVS